MKEVRSKLERALLLKSRIDKTLEKMQNEYVFLSVIAMYSGVSKKELKEILITLEEKGYVEKVIIGDMKAYKLTNKGIQNLEEIKLMLYKEVGISQVSEILNKAISEIFRDDEKAKPKEHSLNKG